MFTIDVTPLFQLLLLFMIHVVRRDLVPPPTKYHTYYIVT